MYPANRKGWLTINGLDKKEYDENGNIEYFTDGALIRAPQARDRFPSNIVNKADAYILMRKEYDTDNKDKLYSMALSDLKTASEPVVTYEVDGYFDTNIGDTVRMAGPGVDADPIPAGKGIGTGAQSYKSKDSKDGIYKLQRAYIRNFGQLITEDARPY